LRTRRFDDEDVVLDTYSGETHCLNPLASAVFERVDGMDVVDLPSLCEILALPGAGKPIPDCTPEGIAGAIACLRDLGLVRVEVDGS